MCVTRTLTEPGDIWLSPGQREIDTLAASLAARKSIERAKGLLMAREGLTEADAFVRLRTASQRSGQPLKVIAEAVVSALG